MAFTLNIVKNVFGQEITIPNAYHRIEKVEGGKHNIVLTLAIYDNTAIHMVDTVFHHFVPSQADDAPRWDKQGYEYLKTLTEYNGSVDC